MNIATRRGAALLAASATLGTAVVTPIATATAAPPVQQRGLLDGLDPINLLLSSLTNPAALQGLLSTLGLTAPAQLGDLLQAANVAQLQTLLDGLTAGQLTGGLGTLTPAELQSVISRVSSGDLSGVFALLSPAQITQLVQGGGLAGAIAGLQSQLSTITAGTPLAGPVDQLLAQVTALIGSTPGANLGQLDALLGPLAPLLATAGLDPSILTGLGNAVTGALASGDPTAGLGILYTLLGLGGGATASPTPTSTTTPGGTTTNPGGTTTNPGGTTTNPGGTTTNPGGTSGTGGNLGGSGNARAVKRVQLKKVKVAKNHRTAKITLRAAAGSSAVVSGKAGAKRAFKSKHVTLAGRKLVLKVRLAKAAQIGGTLKVKVKTVGSGAAPASKRVRI